MLDKTVITEFFQSGGVFYCGSNKALKYSTLTALEECGMKIGFDFRTWDIDTYRYIYYSHNQVHMKGLKGSYDFVIDAEEIGERFEIVDDSWCEDFRVPSFETLFCG